MQGRPEQKQQGSGLLYGEAERKKNACERIRSFLFLQLRESRVLALPERNVKEDLRFFCVPK